MYLEAFNVDVLYTQPLSSLLALDLPSPPSFIVQNPKLIKLPNNQTN